MSRDLHADMIAELNSNIIRPAFFFRGTFGGQELNLWTGTGNISWGGVLYFGNGYLVGFSLPTETEDIRAEGIRVEFSGVPQELISLAFASTHEDTGKLYFATMTEAGDIAGDPYLLFSGFLDVPDISENESSTALVVSYESRLIRLEQPSDHRYTHEGQRAFYPDDTGLRYISSLSDWSGFWGRSG